MLPTTRGSTYIIRVLTVYNDLFRDKYGFHPNVPMAKWGMMLKRLMANHTELQIAAMLIVFFNWQGMGDDDTYEQERLTHAGHPAGWFFNNPNLYEIYLRNVFHLEFDDNAKVEEFVLKSLASLHKE